MTSVSNSLSTPSQVQGSLEQTPSVFPHKVLCQIFLATAEISRKDALKKDPMNPSFRKAMLLPVKFSRVCKLWRRTALSLPSLWTSIDVLVDETSSEDRDDTIVHYIDVWMSRSQTMPLHISMTCNTYDLPQHKALTASFILIRLLEHQMRWKEAYFTFIEEDPTRLYPLTLTNALFLNKLAVQWKKVDPRKLKRVRLLLKRSRRLESLSIEGIPFLDAEKLHALTELSLHGMTVEVPLAIFASLFTHTRNLEILKLQPLVGSFDPSDDWNWDKSGPIILKKLHTLVMDKSDVSAGIMKQLTLPALKSLTCHPFPGNHYIALYNMIDRSKPLLKHFEISDASVDQGLLDPLLPLLRHLETFCIVGGLVFPTLFYALSPNNKHYNDAYPCDCPILCPRLKKLTFKNPSWLKLWPPFDLDDLYIDLLYAALKKRCGALGLIAVIECTRKESGRDGNHRTSRFVVLFNEPDEQQMRRMRKALKRAGTIDIIFEMPLVVMPVD